MPQPQRMSGVLRVGVAIAPDGSRQVLTELPNGAQFCLPRETAMSFAFAVLTVARDLFATKEALDAAVPEAYDRVDEILIRSPRGVQ